MASVPSSWTSTSSHRCKISPGQTLYAGHQRGIRKPFNFHMCWTSNKYDKIRYFKNVDMWYVKEQCESPASMVGPAGISTNAFRTKGSVSSNSAAGRREEEDKYINLYAMI